MKALYSVERKRRFIINTVFFAIIIGVFYLFMKYAFWTVFPFLFAAFIAIVLQKPVNYITRKTPLKKGPVSVMIVLLIFAVLLFVIGLAGTKIVSEVKGFINYLFTTFENIPALIESFRTWCIDFVDFLPDTLEKTVDQSINSLFDKLALSFAEETAVDVAGQTAASAELGGNFNFSWLTTPISGVISTAKQIPSILIACVVSVIASCFITSDYDRIVGFIKRQVSDENRSTLSKTKSLTLATLKKMARAYCIIIFITFCEMSIGLTVLKLIGVYTAGYIPIIAAIIAVVDILPILGTGTILIPWSIVSLVMGDIGMGIGIIIIYVSISVLRQFIEPRMVAGQLGLPPIATLIGMYIGLKTLGVIGMFMFPIIITVVKVLNDDGVIKVWKVPEAKDTPAAVKRKSKTKPAVKEEKK